MPEREDRQRTGSLERTIPVGSLSLRSTLHPPLGLDVLAFGHIYQIGEGLQPRALIWVNILKLIG